MLRLFFLWAHSKASPIKDNDSYARYFLYECGIRNPSKYHQELIDTGYFEEASIEQSLNALKVTELKEILTALGQSTTGKKDALIWRIANNVDDSLIANELFGSAAYDKLLGILLAMNYSGYALGGPIVNLFFKHFRDYKQILTILAILTAGLLVSFQFVINMANKKKAAVLAAAACEETEPAKN